MGNFIDKMNEMLESDMPYKKGESIPGSGGVARPWTGPKPWREARNRSTAGSKSFSDAELKQGYRKIK